MCSLRLRLHLQVQLYLHRRDPKLMWEALHLQEQQRCVEMEHIVLVEIKEEHVLIMVELQCGYR